MSGRGWLDHLSSVLMALVVALIVWLLATEERNPMRSVAPYPPVGEAGLTIEVRNLPETRAAYDLVPRVARLQLRGTDAALRALTPAAFAVVADLSGVPATADSATVDVAVRCRTCAREGLRVVSWEPRRVDLHLAEAVTTTRQVVAVPSDESPVGFTRAFELTPPQVVLRGARPAMARVREVVASLGQGSGTATPGEPQTVAAVAVDAARESVPDIVAEPAQVVVSEVLRRREVEVAVSPKVLGADAVADGYYLTGISVSPQFVQLEGPSDQVQTIRERGSLATLAVDVSGLSGDVERRVGLVLPRDVTALNAPDGVTVTVKLEPLPGTVTREVTVETEGLGAGLQLASVAPEKVTVLVSGPRPLLERLRATDIRAVLDLSGLGPGPQRVTPIIRVPTDVQERSVTPNEVDVIIRASGTPVSQPTRRGPR